MKDYLKIVAKTAIAIFVLWHAFAIAAYVVPRDARDAASVWTRETLIPIVKPYLLTTSQWQLWNLFSPDPLRRVTSYVVEARFGDEWVEVERFDYDTYSIWRNSTHYKMFSNLFDEFANNRGPLIANFLQMRCTELRFGEGLPIRIVYEFYVIPKNEQRRPRQWWDQWKPTIRRTIGEETSCPPKQ